MVKGNEVFEDFLEEDHLYNFENYGVYAELVKTGSINIFTGDINNENLDSHFFSVLNVFRDGIESDKAHRMYINVHFVDEEVAKLSLFYYFYNLILWKLPLECEDPLTSEFLYFPEDLTGSSIKKYIDDKFIEKHQTHMTIRKLNNVIDDCMWKFKYIDEFHNYLLNTIDSEDSISLMKEDKDFYDCIHADMTGVPIEDVKDVGMNIIYKGIEAIKHSDHCLRDAFRTGEGINARQFKEFISNIGTKPDGNGGVYNHVINSSFANGGLQSKEDLAADSGASRTAQILSKENVGDAGHFSRILGLNNQSSRLHDDPNYICNTQNLVKVEIKNEKILDMFKNRWFRYTPTGIEFKISLNPLRDNKDLIGKTLYFRSPMTCASAAKGHGICYRCYGDLAYVNYSLSVGKIAAEILCSILTQMLLSAKHLLESMIVALKWVPEFYNLMQAEVNTIVIKEDLKDDKQLDQYKLEISNIMYDDEHDQFEYNAHVTSFNVIYPNGTRVNIRTEDDDNIYLSHSLLEMIEAMNTDDYVYTFNFADLFESPIFLIKLTNAEISRTLEKITSMIKTSDGVIGKTKEQVLSELIDTVIEGKVRIDSVHLETLLSNQIRKSAQDILEVPDWEIPNAKYHVIGLNKALTDHPSVTVSLQFEKLSKALYYPLNFKKTKPHSTDLFFMTQPQNLDDIPEIDTGEKKQLFTHFDPNTENEKV